jgi:hypothetical protein
MAVNLLRNLIQHVIANENWLKSLHKKESKVIFMQEFEIILTETKCLLMKAV